MLTVDRFEEDKAVVFDDDRQIIICRDKLSSDVKEGDVIVLSDNGIYVTDKAETEQRRNDNLSLLQKLLNKLQQPCGIELPQGCFASEACMYFGMTAAFPES